MGYGPLADFPDSFGAHRGSVFAHRGPASYTQLTTGPLAGGDTVTAAEAGLKYVDAVHSVGLSDSGTYRVEGVAPVGNPSTNKQAAHASSWKLRWTVVATGAQVAGAVDLSAETIRLTAIGRY
jgi:hypothetical protein